MRRVASLRRRVSSSSLCAPFSSATSFFRDADGTGSRNFGSRALLPSNISTPAGSFRSDLPSCVRPRQPTVFSPPHRSRPCPRRLMSSAAPGNGTFVSSYYKVDADDIKDLFKRKNLKFKSQGEHFVVCECPFCSPTAGKADNLWKLYLKKSDGAYFCHRCGQKGSWFDFKTKCGDPGK